MTAFSAAAHDEGGDTTKALRARITELEDMLANLPLSAPQRLRARIQQLEKMLAAVGAGGVGPLMPITVQHQRNHSDDNELQRKTFDLSTTAAPPKTGGIPPDWLSPPEAEIALWQAMHKRNDWGNPADDKLVLRHLQLRGLWIGYKADQMVYPLGKLMDDEIARVKAEQEPAAWIVWWGIGEMRPHERLFKTNAEAEAFAREIKSNTEIHPVSRLVSPNQDVQEQWGRCLVAVQTIEQISAELGKVIDQRKGLLEALKHIARMTNDGYAERHARDAIAQAGGAS